MDTVWSIPQAGVHLDGLERSPCPALFRALNAKGAGHQGRTTHVLQTNQVTLSRDKCQV